MKKEKKQKDERMTLSEKGFYLFKALSLNDPDIISLRFKILNFENDVSVSIAKFFDGLAIVSSGAITLSFSSIGSLINLNTAGVKANIAFLIVGWILLIVSFVTTVMLRFDLVSAKNNIRATLLDIEIEQVASQKEVKFPGRDSKENEPLKEEDFIFKIPEKMMMLIIASFVFGLVAILYFLIKVLAAI